jgi:hypothetical protein
VTERQLESKRKIFKKAGLDPQYYDRLMAVFGTKIAASEPGSQKYLDDPTTLVEVFELMRDVWYDVVYPEGSAPMPQDQIPFDELYSLQGYRTALLECWHNWTMLSVANAIFFIRQHAELQGETVVAADGFGGASIMYALAFPSTKVKAHLMGDVSITTAKEIVQELGINNLQIITQPETAPVVLAFECFEHFYEPQKFAAPFLAGAKLLVHSSPWTVPAHGHFRQYKIDGTELPASEVSRPFGAWLKGLGFVNTARAYNFRHFNGRPEQFVRV